MKNDVVVVVVVVVESSDVANMVGKVDDVGIDAGTTVANRKMTHFLGTESYIKCFLNEKKICF